MLALGFWPTAALAGTGWGLISFGIGRLIGTAIDRSERMGGHR